MSLTNTEIAQVLLESLPVGPLWPRDVDSNWGVFFEAIAPEFSRLSALSDQLVNEMNPATTTRLFDEWEAELGLPDHCITEPQTTSARRAAMVERYTAVGEQSKQFFIDLAARLGFVITIDEFSPTNPGPSGQLEVVKPSGEIFHVVPQGDEWNYVWRVNAPQVSVQRMQVPFQAGDQLATQSNELLECTLRQYAHAHRVLVFAYD